LMAEVDQCRDPGLPFIRFKLEKAAVHAQLAQVQALRCADCQVGARLAEVVELEPKSGEVDRSLRRLGYSRAPVRSVETTGDRL
jgi:hypothetical protein